MIRFRTCNFFQMAVTSRIVLPLLTAAVLLFPSSRLQAVSKTGTSAAQFLKIGVGPRAAALGGSFTALANDASALYWNPAGIAWMNKGHFLASHTNWFIDISHEYIGLVVPLAGATRLGVSFTALNTPEMEQTTIQEPDGTGIYFDVQDISIGLTLARMMTNRFSFGITLKYIQQTLFNESAKTLAIDLGGMLRTGFKGLRLGIAMSNFGGKMKLTGRDLIVSYDDKPNQTGNPLIQASLETQEWPLPINFRIGLAFDLIGRQEGLTLSHSQRLTFLVEGTNENDAPETVSFGAEYAYKEFFFLRGGYRLNHDLENFSAGLGIQIPFQRWKIQADYSLTNMDALDYVQRISLGILF